MLSFKKCSKDQNKILIDTRSGGIVGCCIINNAIHTTPPVFLQHRRANNL